MSGLLLWFPSGDRDDVLGFPECHRGESARRSPALDPSTVRLSPGEASATLGEVQAPRRYGSNTSTGRPVYRFQTGQGDDIVYADTGEEPALCLQREGPARGLSLAGQPVSTATGEAVEEVDNGRWAGLRTLRPLWKYSWPNGEQATSPATPGGCQYRHRIAARRLSRPHPAWLYFTPYGNTRLNGAVL